MYAYEEDSRTRGFSPLFVIVPVIVLLFAGLVKMVMGLVPEIRSTTHVNAALMASKNMVTSENATSELAVFFAAPVLLWEDEIVEWAADFELDPNLVATVMQIESCGNPYAVSHANAQGLFQVMPYHFATGERMQDPDTNAMRGLNYLKEALIFHNGDVRLALAAYNGGLTTSTWSEFYWPEETRRYVYWGEQIYEDASGDALESARFNEWYSVGYPLCQQTEIGFTP